MRRIHGRLWKLAGWRHSGLVGSATHFDANDVIVRFGPAIREQCNEVDSNDGGRTEAIHNFR